MSTKKMKDFSSYFNFQNKLHKIVGIRLEISESKKSSNRAEQANFVYSVACFVIMTVSLSQAILFILLNDSDLEEFLGAIPELVFNITAFSKYICVFANINKIKKMLRTLEKLHEQQKNDQLLDQTYILENTAKIMRYSKITVVLGPFFVLIPFISTLSHLIQDSTWDPLFPFKLWYPFDPKDYYVPVYIYLHFIGLTSSVNMIATDCLFLMILAFVTHQLKQLSKDFANLKEHGQKMAQLVERQIVLLE